MATRAELCERIKVLAKRLVKAESDYRSSQWNVENCAEYGSEGDYRESTEARSRAADKINRTAGKIRDCLDRMKDAMWT